MHFTSGRELETGSFYDIGGNLEHLNIYFFI